MPFPRLPPLLLRRLPLLLVLLLLLLQILSLFWQMWLIPMQSTHADVSQPVLLAPACVPPPPLLLVYDLFLSLLSFPDVVVAPPL